MSIVQPISEVWPTVTPLGTYKYIYFLDVLVRTMKKFVSQWKKKKLDSTKVFLDRQ